MDGEEEFKIDFTRNERYSSDLQRRGIKKSFFDANKKMLCPECGSTFNLLYSRAKFCIDCPNLNRGCELARCVNCHKEFPIRNYMSKENSRITSNYIQSIIKNHNDRFY